MAYFRAGRCQPRLTSSFMPVNCGVASGASSPASTLFLFFRGPLTLHSFVVDKLSNPHIFVGMS